MKSICMAGSAAGYGLIRVMDASFTSKHKFSIQRSSDKQFLGMVGWQDQEEFLTPLAEAMQDANLILEIGPKVVDSLDILETYRFALEGLDAKSHLVVESLTYSQLVGSGAVEETPFIVPPEPVKPQPEMVEPEENTVNSEVSRENIEEETPLAAEKSSPLTSLHMTDPVPPAKRYWWVAVVLLLLLVGGGYFWQKEVVPIAPTTPELPNQATPNQATPEQSAEPAPPVDADKINSDIPGVLDSAPAKAMEQAVATSARSRVIEFMRSGGTAKEAWALSQSLTSDSKVSEANTLAGQDAQFLLIEYAAEGGEAQAMLQLAKIYDPNNAVKQGSIIKDADQAKIWYEKAKQAGLDEQQETAPKN